MKPAQLFPKALILLAVMFMIVAVANTFAQVKSGKSRPVTTSQLMKGIMKPHCTAIKDGLKTGPKDDDAWEDMAMHAALLNELSFTLMDDGRCPDGVWADATTKSLRDGSAELLKAIESKNTGNAKKAFGNLTQSCKACHDKHKE